MKLSYVVAGVLLCGALNADDAASKDVNLGTLTVSSNFKKSILQEPTKVEIAGKDTILENGDIAKSLLNLSGFSMERKGGGGSEVYYRSQTASRLPVLIDGSTLNGGCGMRMDTPITYISAQNYNSVRIVKGPQDVRYGALISGGIFFDRDILRLDKTQFGGNFSVLGGSFRRFETVADAVAGNELGSLQISGGHYESGDYKNGDGKKMHTRYKRRSVSLVGTITPTDSTAIQLSTDLGEGKAAYADRMRDGSKFDRKSFGAKLEQELDNHKLRLSSYYHEVDHVMDNYSMRYKAPGVKYGFSNPIRQMKGIKGEVELNFGDLTSYIGAGYSKGLFKFLGAQATTKAQLDKATSKPHTNEREVTYKSIYTQNEFVLEDDLGLFGGIRLDHGKRRILSTNKSRSEDLLSGFFRFEKYLQDLTLYAGLGHAQRMPDHWETNRDANLKLKKEKNTQLDLGAVLKDQNYELSASLFASKIDDYILIKYGGAGAPAFNTDALLYGGEVEGEILLQDLFKFGAGASYVYGRNLKDAGGLKNGDALPKISPLTFKLSAGLERPEWFIGANFYANAAQTRTAKGYGDVGGMDLGKSDSFWTVGLNAGYKYKNYQILLAAENLNDALYSYHNSKGGFDGGIAGYETIPSGTRLYEPGRSFWAKFKAHF